jgi:hypothetical protein
MKFAKDNEISPQITEFYVKNVEISTNSIKANSFISPIGEGASPLVRKMPENAYSCF